MNNPAIAARCGHRCLAITMGLLTFLGSAAIGLRAQVEVLEIPVVAFEGDPVLTTGRSITGFSTPVVNNEDRVVAAISSLREEPLDSSSDVVSWVRSGAMEGLFVKVEGSKYFAPGVQFFSRNGGVYSLAQNGAIAGAIFLDTAPGVALARPFLSEEDVEVTLRQEEDPAPGRDGKVAKSLVNPFTRVVLLNDAGTLAFIGGWGKKGFNTLQEGFDLYRKRPGDPVEAAVMWDVKYSVDRAGETGPADIAYRGPFELAINDKGLLAFIGNSNVQVEVPDPGQIVPVPKVTRVIKHVVRETSEGALGLVAREGGPAPGFEASENVVFLNKGFDISSPAYNDKGQVAFLAGLFVGSEYPNGTFQRNAIYVGSNPDDLALVIARGMLANKFFDVGSTIGGDALEITNIFTPPLLNNNGQVLLSVDVGNFTVGSVQGRGLLLYDPTLIGESKTRVVADLLEWTDDTEQYRIFRATEKFALDRSGNTAFTAMIVANGSSNSFEALFYRPFNGALETIVKVGDTVEVRGGNREVSAINFQGGSTSSGQPVGMTDFGGIVFGLTFKDGTSGIFKIGSVLPTLDFEFAGLYESAPQNWHADVSNWRDNANGLEASTVPGDGSNESVGIDGFDVILDTRAVEVKSINATGSLSVENDLSLTGAESSIENLSLAADLTLGGPLALTGDINFWTSGKIAGVGKLKNGGMLSLGAPEETLNMSVTLETLDGGITVVENGTIDLGIDGQIAVFPGGVFGFSSGAVTSHAPSGSFTNEGTVRKSGTETGTIDVSLFENDKTARIEVNEGTLSFTGAGQLTGTLETKLDATTRFFTGSYTLSNIDGDTFIIRGPGPVKVESSALLVSAGGELIVEDSGPFSGLILQGNDAILYGEGTTIIKESGHLRIAPETETEISAQLTVEGLLEFAAGKTTIDSGSRSFLNLGTVVARPNASAKIHSVDDVSNLTLIDFLPGWGLGHGEYLIENGSVDLVPVGENVVVPINAIGAEAFVRLVGTDASLNNLPTAEGFLTVFGRLQLRDLDFAITGDGILEVIGTLSIGPGTNVAAKLLKVFENGVVYLNTIGALPDELMNSGTVEIGASPGSASIEGDYSQTGTGVLVIEIGGLEAGSDYDVLNTGGTATFEEGSKITITLIDPNPEDEVDEIFIPRTGDVFSFLSAADIEVPTGLMFGDIVEFSNLPTGVDLGLQLDVVDGMTVVTLAAESTLTPPVGPRIISHPATQMANAGGPVTFSVGADSADAFTYQWRLNGIDIPDAVDATYTLPIAQTTNSGDYSVVVTADGVSAASKVAMLEVAAPPPNDARLLNLSTRAVSLTGNNVLIPGFVIEGTGTKNLLIRAVGASLLVDPFNIATALEDPQMTLKQWTGSAFEDVEANDDWETNPNAADITQSMIDLGAFALTDSRDAALLTDLDAGRYTVIAGGVGDLTGVAIVELYDGDGETTTTVLKNISNRGFVGTGASIMIPGVTVSAEGPKTFLIRAVGPALGQEPFNLTGVLEDPKMTVFSGPTPILSNDNWGDSPDAANTAAVAALLGAFALPEGSKDAAMVVTLPPGGYTIQAAGVDGATGTAIVEVYVVE